MARPNQRDSNNTSRDNQFAPFVYIGKIMTKNIVAKYSALNAIFRSQRDEQICPSVYPSVKTMF